MVYSDMHTHGWYSDGKGTFPEFIESAGEKKISTLGFSDHSPVPLDNTWSMKKASLDSYFNELNHVKKNFNSITDVYAGMELDYIPGIDVMGYIDFENLPLDYFIGSVHYVYSAELDKYIEVDGPEKTFQFLVEEGFKGDAEAVYKSYYNNVREMISSYVPAIVAHVDLIKKNNKEGKFFDEHCLSYKKEVDETLDLIKLYGSIIEINTGAMSRGYKDKPYPSEYILKKCLERKIPVALNSDSHTPQTLAYEFQSVISFIKKMGFRELITYQKGRWVPVNL